MKLTILATLALLGFGCLARATTFIVTSTADPGNGVCTAASTGDGCTLREPITAANANGEDDIIVFTGLSGTIQLTGPLISVTAGSQCHWTGVSNDQRF